VKRLISLWAVSGTVVVGGVFGLAAGAANARTHAHAAGAGLPTLKVAVRGGHGIKVTGSMVSGAVKVVSTFSGKVPKSSQGGPAYGLVRLDPGVSVQQAFQAVHSHGGDINGLTPYGSLFVDAVPGGTIETTLKPGNYVALNITGNGQPAFQTFTVTKSSSPAKLPAAKATEKSIEFGFRGPKVLHNGTMVRAENAGFLVHMDILVGVRNARTGRKVMALLKAGKDGKAGKLVTHSQVTLLGPGSPGAMQQMVLHTKPGYYVQLCFMDTQDGREHTQLGMERMIKVVK
jgi:hypothetical protein